MKNKRPDLTPDKTNDPTDRLLTIAEVAAQCRCSQQKVRQWVSEGKILSVSLGDRLTRIRESALIKFWRKKEKEATP